MRELIRLSHGGGDPAGLTPGGVCPVPGPAAPCDTLQLMAFEGGPDQTPED
jgi:hypothetical protein